MKKHFDLEISDGHFTYQRKTDQINAEAALDGIYVLRTSIWRRAPGRADVVRAYKELQHVERAFRVLKGPELEIRPIHHRLEAPRPRARLPLHARALPRMAPARRLGRADLPRRTAADRPTPSPRPRRSAAAQHKADTKRTTTDQPGHTFRSLLAELATQTRNTIRAGRRAARASIGGPAGRTGRVDRDLLERALAAHAARRRRVEERAHGVARERPGDLDVLFARSSVRPAARGASISPSP